MGLPGGEALSEAGPRSARIDFSYSPKFSSTTGVVEAHS